MAAGTTRGEGEGSASRSRLDTVERWFGEPTEEKLERGDHTSIPTLERGIHERAANWNDGPRPSVWTKTADHILNSLAGHRQRISGSAHQPTPGLAIRWPAIWRGRRSQLRLSTITQASIGTDVLSS